MIVVNMTHRRISELVKEIFDRDKDCSLEIKLQFEDEWNARIYCKDGKLLIIDQPPITLFLTSLNTIGLEYNCDYHSGDNYAILRPRLPSIDS